MGIDVYSGDGVVDWKKVHAAGHSFAFCKCTEGETLVDDKFIANMRGMKDANMVRGAYHFHRLSVDPVKQAHNFLKVLDLAGYNFKTDMPPCLDIEDRVGTKQYGPDKLRRDVSTFLHEIEKVSGRLCVLYMDYDFAQNILGDGYGGHPLWIASLTTKPKPMLPSYWKNWTFWQYTFTGTVDGVPSIGGLDMDHYNGTEAQLRAWASSGK